VRLALALLTFALALACDRSPPPVVSAPSSPSAIEPPAPQPKTVIQQQAPDARPRSIDAQALARLEADARATDSAALIVIQAGRIVLDWSPKRVVTPIETMSITKSILALLVGCLVEKQELRVEQRVSELFPEYDRRVSVLHLLTHSSGMQEGEKTIEIYASKSFVQHALSSPIVHEPGTHYEYGNRASNLLAGLIARAAKKRTDEVARECLFEPLGITRWTWSRDRAGSAHGLAGLHLLPRDLARIGELVLAGGEWQGRRVLSREWIRRVTEEPAPVQPEHKRLAHLWWLLTSWSERRIDRAIIDRWRAAGVEAALIDQLRPLEGQVFRSTVDFVRALREKTGDPKLERFEAAIWKKKLPDASFRFGPVVGSYAAGSLGQYVVIVPRDRLIAVRMRRAPRDHAEREDLEKSFPDFPERVAGLVASR
jgi:CubicO group peptidase (beta-lactamase class C family)